MNLKNSKYMFLLFFSFFSILSADNINASFELIRNWDKEGNTDFSINFDILLREFEPKLIKNDYKIEFGIKYNIYKDNNIVYEDSCVNSIKLQNIKQLKNNNYHFFDYRAFPLQNNGYSFDITVFDKNSEKEIKWNCDLPVLDSVTSDLEFIQKLQKQNKKTKFYRDGFSFDCNPNHIINKTYDDTVFVFFQTKSNILKVNEIKIYNPQNENFITDVNFKPLDNNFYLIGCSVSNFIEGYQEIEFMLSLEDNSTVKKNSFVVIKENSRIIGPHIFNDYEDEKRLISLFFKNSKKHLWDNLDEKDGWFNIYNFWDKMDNNKNDDKNDFLEIVRERVEYVNQHFESRNKKGWETDRGRIYIRYGNPSEVLTGFTDRNNIFGNLDCHVWKYRNNKQSTYVFIDVAHDNSYKLIVVDGDILEHSSPNANNYFGIELNKEYRLDFSKEDRLSTPGTFDKSIFY